MNMILIFATQFILTILTCLALAAYLRSTLRQVLCDLCGTDERARFWTAFSNIMLVVLPAIFSLGFHPEIATLEDGFFQIASQLRWNLMGFIMSLVAIGAAVSFFALVSPRPQKTNKE